MELLKSIATFYLTYLSPVLDILLLAFLMYKSYQILVKTQAMQLGKGALIMGGIYAVAFVLHLTTMLWLLHTVATGVVIGAAIIFQPEEAIPIPNSYNHDLISPDTWNAGFRITNNSDAPLRHLRLEMSTLQGSSTKSVEVQGLDELSPGESTDIVVPLGGYFISGNERIGWQDFWLKLYADAFEPHLAAWVVGVFTEKYKKGENPP